MLYAFNPISGDHMTFEGDHVTSGDGHMTCLGVVRQLMVLPHLDHTHSHTLLYVTQDMKVIITSSQLHHHYIIAGIM